MGIAPEHPEYRGAARGLPRALRGGALRATPRCSPTSTRCSTRSRARSLKWGIVTNKATRYTTPLLERLGLGGRAGAVVCGDTTPFAKPHPAPLLAAAGQLGVAPARCVYVGDAERDVDGRHRRGHAHDRRPLRLHRGARDAGDLARRRHHRRSAGAACTGCRAGGFRTSAGSRRRGLSPGRRLHSGTASPQACRRACRQRAPAGSRRAD